MTKTANPEWKPSKGSWVSPWLVALKTELTERGRAPDEAGEAAGARLKVVDARDTLWGRLTWGDGGGGLALRLAYAPGGVDLTEAPHGGPWGTYRLRAALGELTVELSQPDPAKPLIRWRTTLTPSAKLVMPYWPRDVVPIDAEGDPLKTRGIVHATQRGPKAALLYGALAKPTGGSFLYVQDLTSLDDYCDVTRTQPFARVGGEWPELGFSLPTTAEHPLPAGEPVVISDALLRVTEEMPSDHLTAARLFIDLFADIYLEVQRPETQYHDWLARAEDTLRDLESSKECLAERRGLRFFNAYVGGHDQPPESMVQLAVLMPILDYLTRRGGEWPMADEIAGGLGAFFNPTLKTLVRWLPGSTFDKPDEEKNNHHNMDCWYLYHILLNAGRLALKGNPEAKRLLLASLPYAQRVAHHFEYRWPIFYDMRTLEPVKATTKQGFGETDVAGLYALVMLQARDITGDDAYRKEAEAAAETLRPYGFQLAYQFNSTIYAAVALARLWRETRYTLYRDLSYVCIANFLHNTWLWQCRYGHGDAYPTFFGLPPLHDAPYIAIYEEQECLEAFASYLELGGDELPESIQMLLPEYSKHLLHRGWYSYPQELPAKLLAEDVHQGHLDRKLAIPLEDLGDGWYAPGQVGQEVYGAGAAPLFAAWAYHSIEEGGFLVFSEYITSHFDGRGDRKRGRVTFEVRGSPRLAARLRMIPDGRASLPRGLRLRYAGRRGHELPLRREGKHREAIVRGGSRLVLEWGT